MTQNVIIDNKYSPDPSSDSCILQQANYLVNIGHLAPFFIIDNIKLIFQLNNNLFDSLYIDYNATVNKIDFSSYDGLQYSRLHKIQTLITSNPYSYFDFVKTDKLINLGGAYIEEKGETYSIQSRHLVNFEQNNLVNFKKSISQNFYFTGFCISSSERYNHWICFDKNQKNLTHVVHDTMQNTIESTDISSGKCMLINIQSDPDSYYFVVIKENTLEYLKITVSNKNSDSCSISNDILSSININNLDLNKHNISDIFYDELTNERVFYIDVSESSSNAFTSKFIRVKLSNSNTFDNIINVSTFIKDSVDISLMKNKNIIYIKTYSVENLLISFIETNSNNFLLKYRIQSDNSVELFSIDKYSQDLVFFKLTDGELPKFILCNNSQLYLFKYCKTISDIIQSDSIYFQNKYKFLIYDQITDIFYEIGDEYKLISYTPQYRISISFNPELIYIEESDEEQTILIQAIALNLIDCKPVSMYCDLHIINSEGELYFDKSKTTSLNDVEISSNVISVFKLKTDPSKKINTSKIYTINYVVKGYKNA